MAWILCILANTHDVGHTGAKIEGYRALQDISGPLVRWYVQFYSPTDIIPRALQVQYTARVWPSVDVKNQTGDTARGPRV